MYLKDAMGLPKEWWENPEKKILNQTEADPDGLSTKIIEEPVTGHFLQYVYGPQKTFAERVLADTGRSAPERKVFGSFLGIGDSSGDYFYLFISNDAIREVNSDSVILLSHECIHAAVGMIRSISPGSVSLGQDGMVEEMICRAHDHLLHHALHFANDIFRG